MGDFFQEQLDQIHDAGSDPHARAAALAEMAVHSLPESERPSFRSLLDTASVLHWFNPDILEKMIPEAKEPGLTPVRFEQLTNLPFTDPIGIFFCARMASVNWMPAIA